jgi:hypothetical protein
MTTLRVSYEEARLNLRCNKHAYWFPAGEIDPSRPVDGHFAVARIRRGLARIEPQPRLPVAERVYFTIGSCFAGVIENEFHMRRIPVPSRDLSVFDDHPDLFRSLRWPASTTSSAALPQLICYQIRVVASQ